MFLTILKHSLRNIKEVKPFLPSLSVTNDQLTLTTTNWYQWVYSLDTSLHRFSDGYSGDDTRGLDTNSEPERQIEKKTYLYFAENGWLKQGNAGSHIVFFIEEKNLKGKVNHSEKP